MRKLSQLFYGEYLFFTLFYNFLSRFKAFFKFLNMRSTDIKTNNFIFFLQTLLLKEVHYILNL